MRHISA